MSNPYVQPRVGGHTPVDTKNESIQELAEWVVTEAKKAGRGSFTLMEIIEAQTQVVAGTNYSLKLKLAEEGSPNYVAAYNVVVFQDLCGVRWLTGFSKA